jgi:hypothetical protein
VVDPSLAVVLALQEYLPAVQRIGPWWKRMTAARDHVPVPSEVLSPSDCRQEIVRLLSETKTVANDNAATQERAQRAWARAYLLLGVPSVILAAVAGGTGLASAAGRLPAAWMALLAAALTALTSFLNSDARRSAAASRAAGWRLIAADAAQLRIFVSEASLRDLVIELNRLARRSSALLSGDVAAAAAEAAEFGKAVMRQRTMKRTPARGRPRAAIGPVPESVRGQVAGVEGSANGSPPRARA